jgi:hypothetical protein
LVESSISVTAGKQACRTRDEGVEVLIVALRALLSLLLVRTLEREERPSMEMIRSLCACLWDSEYGYEHEPAFFEEEAESGNEAVRVRATLVFDFKSDAVTSAGGREDKVNGVDGDSDVASVDVGDILRDIGEFGFERVDAVYGGVSNPFRWI